MKVLGLTHREWMGAIPFISVHLIALFLIFYTGLSFVGLFWCLGSYFVRMMFLTLGFHRYFSHRSYKTSRWFQTLLAIMGSTTIQRGVLNWTYNHRDHHRYSDTNLDPHSPVAHGFWFSHMGWVLSDQYTQTLQHKVGDLSKYWELRVLDKVWLLVSILYFVALYFIGGLVALTWGGFVATVLLWHFTFMVNSVCHTIGARRFQTNDNSRNVWWLAIPTFGESYQNCHHYFQYSANQGMKWSEIDLGFYILKIWGAFGLVWDLKEYRA